MTGARRDRPASTALPGSTALPAFAGVLLALSYPPARLFLLAFVGLVPLLVYIAERPAGVDGLWAATRAGLITGAVYFGLQLYWMAVALLPRSALALPAYVGMVLVLAALTGAFGWAVHYTAHRLPLPLPLLAALFWTLLEWVQGHLGDLAFPWLGLGTALAPFPTLAGAADLVGARGLTVWIAAVNGLVATAVLRWRAGRSPVPGLLGALVLVALPASYGAYRAATLEIRPAARVALVQPNITEAVKRDPSLALDSSLTALTRLTSALVPPGRDGPDAAAPDLAEAHPDPPAPDEARPDEARPHEARPHEAALDLVVWPEVALPVELRHPSALRQEVERLSARVGAPILVGAYGADAGASFNSAFLVDGRPGQHPAPRYDKRRLVPFVERVPFIDPAVLDGTLDDPRRYGGLDRGGAGPPMRTSAAPGSGQRFGVLICYESIFPSLARSYRQGGASFLVNITNDAWYGRDTWWGRTTALWQHPAHVVLRAIETRTGVARAANTGFSLFVDPLGRVHQRTQLFEPDVVVGTVHTARGTTLFVRWGDWLASLAAATALLVLGAAWLSSAPGPGTRLR